jgi:hypothetical protein
MAPDRSSLLTLDAASVQTAPDGSRPIVWMIIGMIDGHRMNNRMPPCDDAASGSGEVRSDQNKDRSVQGHGGGGQ